MNAGISRSFWAGFCCYVFACGAFLWAALPGTKLSIDNSQDTDQRAVAEGKRIYG
jgi:hypothetical protein